MTLATAAVVTTLAVGIVTLIRLSIPPIFKAYRRLDATCSFTVDMATNHLPHIYHAQTKICQALNIDLDEPMPVIHYGQAPEDK